MKKLVITILILLSITAIDLFLPMAHEGAFWQHWPGGYGLFGILFCLLLIIVAKTLGDLILFKAGEKDD